MRWRPKRWRGALAALAMTSALALGLTWAAAPAHASSGCGTIHACIHWSSNMIYAGQNNGFPEGPVGEHASVTGEGFQTNAGQQISLRLVKGDVNTDPGGSPYEFCKLANPRVDSVATNIPVDGSGNFTTSFDWPAAAGSGEWSVCAIGPDGFPAGGGNIDDGPFSVMSSHAPSLSLSTNTVNPGESVTVTGHNWLPGQGQIFVYAGSCADCDGPPLTSATVTSDGAGSFTATLSVPAEAPPGSYIVSAHNQSGVLDTTMSGPHLTVALVPTATAQPTATLAPTATTASSNGGGSSSAGGSSGGAAGWLVPMLLGAGGVLALVLLGVGLFFLVGRKPPTTPPDGGPRSGPPGGAPTYTPPAPSYTPAGPNDTTQVDLPPPGR
jgi:hypothetical protein